MRLGLKQAIDFIERKVLFIDLAAVIRIDVALEALLEKFILIHPNEAAVYGVKQLSVALGKSYGNVIDLAEIGDLHIQRGVASSVSHHDGIIVGKADALARLQPSDALIGIRAVYDRVTRAFEMIVGSGAAYG